MCDFCSWIVLAPEERKYLEERLNVKFPRILFIEDEDVRVQWDHPTKEEWNEAAGHSFLIKCKGKTYLSLRSTSNASHKESLTKVPLVIARAINAGRLDQLFIHSCVGQRIRQNVPGFLARYDQNGHLRVKEILDVIKVDLNQNDEDTFRMLIKKLIRAIFPGKKDYECQYWTRYPFSTALNDVFFYNSEVRCKELYTMKPYYKVCNIVKTYALVHKEYMFLTDEENDTLQLLTRSVILLRAKEGKYLTEVYNKEHHTQCITDYV